MVNETINKMKSIFVKKNHDYGNSAHIGYEKFGYISYIVRIHDKLMRLETLKNGEINEVKDESIEDTLLDAANYLVMLMGDILYDRSRGANAPFDKEAYSSYVMTAYDSVKRAEPLVIKWSYIETIDLLNNELKSNSKSGFALIICEDFVRKLIEEYDRRTTERGTNN